MTAQIAGLLPESLQDLHTGIALYHPETGRIRDANDRFVSLYGYSIDRLRGMEISEYSANTSPLSQTDIVDRIRAAGAGNSEQFQWRVKRGDGELIWVDISLSPISVEGDRYVLAEVRDVTDRVYDNRRVRLLTRIIRHNLRNDTNVIIGYARQIQSLTDSEPVHDHLAMIQQEARDLSSITDSVSQIEQAIGRTDTYRTNRRARQVIAETVDTYRTRYPGATISIDERTEMWVRADQTFRYAVSHAVENAIVHNDRPEPAVDIRIDDSPNTGRTEICITDDCPRIPEMELDALDESTAFSATSHGSGVGLFVMKWCVESLGGELKIEQARERGNSVYFYLPNADRPEQTG